MQVNCLIDMGAGACRINRLLAGQRLRRVILPRDSRREGDVVSLPFFSIYEGLSASGLGPGLPPSIGKPPKTGMSHHFLGATLGAQCFGVN